MKYDMERSLEEILERSKKLKKQSELMRTRIFGSVMSALAVAIMVILYDISGSYGTESMDSFYGSFMISKEAGLYVIVGMICFIVGICFTILVLKYRQKNTDK